MSKKYKYHNISSTDYRGKRTYHKGSKRIRVFAKTRFNRASRKNAKVPVGTIYGKSKIY